MKGSELSTEPNGAPLFLNCTVQPPKLSGGVPLRVITHWFLFFTVVVTEGAGGLTVSITVIEPVAAALGGEV